MATVMRAVLLSLASASGNLVETDGTVVMDVDDEGAPMYHNVPGMTMRDLEIALGVTEEDWKDVDSSSLEVDASEVDHASHKEHSHHIHQTETHVEAPEKADWIELKSPFAADEEWQLVIDPSKSAVPLGNEVHDFFIDLPREKPKDESADNTPRPDEDKVVNMRMHAPHEPSKLMVWLSNLNKPYDIDPLAEPRNLTHFREHAAHEPSRLAGLGDTLVGYLHYWFPPRTNSFVHPDKHMRTHVD